MKLNIIITGFAIATGMMLPLHGQSQSETTHPDGLSNLPVSKEIIKNTRAFRERLLSDPYRPAYHFCIPEDNGRPGDPNGAFYHNGQYHLMYLYNREGRGFSWGHISSKDLVHWRNHPDAIGPSEGDEGCFSGGAFIDDDGAAILSYWMLWGDKGIGLAKSTDPSFNNWTKFTNNPVVKSSEWGITEMIGTTADSIHIGSADPSNIWKKDGRYYMLTGNLLVLNKYGRAMNSPDNEKGDRLYLFESDDLINWKYLHRFYDSRRDWTDASEDNMCPSFLPLPESPEGGKTSEKHLMLFISHNKGCQYYIGDYDKRNDKFNPLVHGRMTWNDNKYFAPEALVDDKGRQIMWAWVFDERPEMEIQYRGWTGTYGLPRSLWLGEDGTLRMQPVSELKQLRLNKQSENNISVASGKDVLLKGMDKELMELEITFQPTQANEYGVKVCSSDDGSEETIISYNQVSKKLKVDTRKSSVGFGPKTIEEAPLELKNNEPLVLRIFIDKSIVEVFANDKQAIGRHIYPTLRGTNVKIFSDNATTVVKSINAWEIFPSNPY